jgi:multidrug efflux pump subunit AcrB
VNIPALFVRHPRLVAAAVFTIAVWGVIALTTMARQEDPAIGWRLGNIVTQLPGESPSRVESLITDQIEHAVREVDEVSHVYSVSRSGVSLVQVQLGDDVSDVGPVWQKVRHKLLSVAGQLPPGTIGPELNDEIMGVYSVVAAITGKDRSYRELKDQAEALEDALRFLPRTASTELFGMQQEMVEVELDQAKLAAYDLSFQNVAAAIAKRNTRQPAGRLHVHADELLIEASGEIESDSELAEMELLVTPDGQTLRLGDVGKIRRTTIQPAQPLARINGQPAVMVGARAHKSVRLDDYGAEVARVIDRFREKLPKGMQVEVLQDLAKYIRQRSSDLGGELWQCILFVVLSTVVFIGWRTTAIISTALPLTALIVLVLFYMFGMPLHQMSVMALIMALGMDVDCATVVTEQIHHRWAKEGGDIWHIAAQEANALILPLTVSTLTTCAAFLPIFLLPGGTGEFVRAIPVGVSVCLLTSLFVAVTVIPCICAFVFRNLTDEKAHDDQSASWFPALARARHAMFHRFVVGVTRHPVISLLLVVTVMSGMTSVGLLLRRDFFSPVQRDQVIVDVYAPQGSALAHTLELVEPVEKLLSKIPEVTSVGSFVGRNAPLVFYNLWVQETYANHYAQLIVNVSDWRQTAEVAQRIQEQLDDQVSEAHYVVHVLEHGAPFVAPFEVRISGPSLEVLEELGRRATSILAATPGVRNIRNNFGNQALELVADVNEPVARRIGIDQGTVADELRHRIDGLVASQIQEGDERIDINVRLAGAQRDDIADLNAVYFKPTPSAPLIPFSSVATLSPRWKAASIYRRDSERTLSVLAYPQFGLTAAQVSRNFEPQLTALASTLPPDYRLELGGESEQRHDAESNLRNKTIYTFCIIILLLVLEFHSLRLAGLILAIVPLSIGGAMVGLWLTGWPLNFMAIMGMTMLAGMLVTNAVILVDGYERRREAGEAMPQLVIEGTQERSLHVVVTTANTITGFIPLAISASPLWPPMAIAMIGGLSTSVLVCFVLVPAAYTLLRGGAQRPTVELA